MGPVASFHYTILYAKFVDHFGTVGVPAADVEVFPRFFSFCSSSSPPLAVRVSWPPSISFDNQYRRNSATRVCPKRSASDKGVKPHLHQPQLNTENTLDDSVLGVVPVCRLRRDIAALKQEFDAVIVSFSGCQVEGRPSI